MGDDHPACHSISHPLYQNLQVRFVKNCDTGTLYFNIKDFLAPYSDKKYSKVIKSLLPRRHRNLEKVWIQTNAWNEIRDGINQGKEKDVISGWKERDLF